MICPKCNTENPEDASFCRDCGVQFGEAAPAPDTKRGGIAWGRVVLCLFILVIAGLIIIPNFIEVSPKRPKTSRAKSDMRSLATAIEAYNVDEGRYPLWSADAQFSRSKFPIVLTTPVAYLTSIPSDPLAPPDRRAGDRWSANYYRYYSTENTFIIWSAGPDEDYDLDPIYLRDTAKFGENDEEIILNNFVYDPTNGTKSSGDVFRLGGVRLKLLEPQELYY